MPWSSCQEEAGAMPGAQSLHSGSLWGALYTQGFFLLKLTVALPQFIFETCAWDLSNNQDGRCSLETATIPRTQGSFKMQPCCNLVTLPSRGLSFLLSAEAFYLVVRAHVRRLRFSSD